TSWRARGSPAITTSRSLRRRNGEGREAGGGGREFIAMNAWFEREWQRLGGGALVFLPLTLVFALVVAIRRALFRWRILPSWRARAPVVVVGNISVGGTGKTPLVIAIVELLRRK